MIILPSHDDLEYPMQTKEYLDNSAIKAVDINWYVCSICNCFS
jgi:hypothetical protein